MATRVRTKPVRTKLRGEGAGAAGNHGLGRVHGQDEADAHHVLQQHGHADHVDARRLHGHEHADDDGNHGRGQGDGAGTAQVGHDEVGQPASQPASQLAA